MIGRQMLCFVTPGVPVQLAARGLEDGASPNAAASTASHFTLPRSLTRRLDISLRAAGCVHFSTLALLPPRPPDPASASDPGPPSLLLEVVVDEGVSAAAAVDTLLRTGFAAWWRLYRHAYAGPRKAGVEVRRRWLNAYLLEHASAADCGFVGARDRSVAQILAEQRLLQAARQQLAAVGQAPGQSPEERAAHLLKWARDNPLGGIAEPARRSFWRLGNRPDAVRWALISLRLGLPAVALLSLFGLLGLSVALLPLQLGAPLGGLDPTALASSEVGVPLMTLLVLGLFAAVAMLILAIQTAQAVVALAVVALFGLTAAVAVIATLVVMMQWTVFWCGVQLVSAGVSALLALLSGFAVLLALWMLLRVLRPPFFLAFTAIGVAAIAAGLSFVFSLITQGHMTNLSCVSLRWPAGASIALSTRAVWVAVTVVVMFGSVLAVASVWPRVQQAVAARLRSLDEPRVPLTVAAHQVHPSIDVCEARLIGRQSHMISITELRQPAGILRFRLRRVLSLVQGLAEVVFTEGRLGEASGIKFGHWRLIDKGRRLLFCSNYDGAFGGYLDAFIDGASQGVNLIWGSTELRPRPAAWPGQPAVSEALAFPPVRGLIFQGCKHEQAFKAYARASMVPHLYRFEAYTLSLQDIERATRLRNALAATPAAAPAGMLATRADQIVRAIES